MLQLRSQWVVRGAGETNEEESAKRSNQKFERL